MIIHQPEIIRQDGQIIVWTKIEFDKPRQNFPEFLWYRVPEGYSHYLSPQSDPFLLPGLIGGMYYGEKISVRGTVSPRLAYHLEEYQYLLNRRLGNEVRPVEIAYEQLSPLMGQLSAVGSTFSGGVDSLHTLWVHRPENQSSPEFHITHVTFIMGFDIIRAKEAKYRQLLDRYKRALQEINVEVIPIETNAVRIVVPRLYFNYYISVILAGCAHLFGRLFKRYFIPSSRDYSMVRFREHSSDSLADALLSSDSLDIIHHAETHQRVEKIKEISDWSLAQDHLRVCSITETEDNCSRCEKCLRTMLPIYSLGKMEDFKTFGKPLRSNWEALRWARKLDPSRHYEQELIPFIKEHNREMIPWLQAAISLGILRYGLLRLMPNLLKQWLRRFGYFLDPKLEKGAFENQEVISIIQHTVDSV